MKFTPGPIGADFSGSIGSTTASRNRYGPYLRTKAIPVNPNTVRQQAVRAIFSTLVNVWTSTLTQIQRDEWSNWAANTPILGKDGSPINITGQNAFIRFNAVRVQIDRPRVLDAPLAFNNGAPITSFEAEEDGVIGVIEIAFGGAGMATKLNIAGGASADGDIAVYLGAPVNASREFFKGPYQFSSRLIVVDGAFDAAWDTLLVDMEQTLTVAVTQFRSVRFRVVSNDGRLSEKFEALAEVTIATI